MTPVGSELSATDTEPVNPFTGEAPTVKDCAGPPGTTEMVDGATSRVNPGLLPPPHPARAVAKSATTSDANFR